MEHRAISSIREIIRLTFIGTLVLFFIAETAFAQDALFVHPVVVLAISGIAGVLWYWGQSFRVT
jgi:hypothetical protein